MRILAHCCWSVFLFLALLLAEGDAEGDGWLCDQVRSMALTYPGKNVIGFAEGSYKLRNVSAHEDVEYPVGCKSNSARRSKGGVGNITV